MHWNVSNKLALAAFVVSIISLTLGVWNQIENRSYDEFKSRPWLDLHFTDQNDAQFYGVTLRNVGNSAAIIDSVFLFTHDGLAAEGSDKAWKEVLQHLDIPDIHAIKTTSFRPGAAIAPNEAIRIAGVMKTELTPELRGHAEKFRNQMMFGVCYSSIFGEKFFESAETLKESICASLK